MKKLVLAILMIMSCYAFASQASTGPMAETQISGDASFTKELITLFAKEAAIPHSQLNDYLSALKANPENEDYYIEDTISDMDIIRLESGAGGGTFEINYLIIIRAGYKSNTFQVGYLKAQVIAPMDENEPASLRITAPANVVIE